MGPYGECALVEARDRARWPQRCVRDGRLRVNRLAPDDVARDRWAPAGFGLRIDRRLRREPLLPVAARGKAIVARPLCACAQSLDCLDRLILAFAAYADEIAAAPYLHDSRAAFGDRQVDGGTMQIRGGRPEHARMQHPGELEVMNERTAGYLGREIGPRDAAAEIRGVVQGGKPRGSGDRAVHVD